MEEWMDVYDVSGKKTGKTVLRGSSLQEGEYVLCTHVILRNLDGRFLIQQRSGRIYPGWSVRRAVWK